MKRGGKSVGAIEPIISAVLRSGVIASLSAVVLGTLVSFVHHPSYLSSRAELAPLTNPGEGPTSLGEVLAGVLAGRGQALVTLGLLLLIATPVARVALSLLLFARDRERSFIYITATVLSLLALSFLVGATTG